MDGELERLQAALRSFAKERGWEVFHSPKNLAMALAAEAGELLAEFQWLTVAESEEASQVGPLRTRVGDEIADVTIYLLRLCDVLDVDPLTLAADKLARNEERFPAARVQGRALRGRDVTP